MVHDIYYQILFYFFRTTLRHFEGDKNQLVELYNKTTIVAQQSGIPGPGKSLLNLIQYSISDFVNMRNKIAFKISEFIYFVTFIFIKGFPLTICNMPKKHLYENKENLQMYAIVKLGFSRDYDGFEQG